MPLETGTYISDFVTSNPAASDGMNGADDHMRWIKAAVKTTFPNVTGAVTGTHTALNAATTAATSGASKLADAGAFFNTNAFDGVKNPSAGKVDIVARNSGGTASAVVAEFTGSTLTTDLKGPTTVAGTLAVTGSITGPGSVPIGGCILWWTDTLPTDGVWAWANGQIISSANTTCPTLLALWGNRFGGNGTTTMGMPDLREVVPVGKSTMGGTSARALDTWNGTSALTTINGTFGSPSHTLTTAQMPVHNHGVTDPGHVHPLASTFGSDLGGRSDSIIAAGTGAGFLAANSLSATTGITINNAGSGSAHNNTQPSTVCNYIVRIA